MKNNISFLVGTLLLLLVIAGCKNSGEESHFYTDSLRIATELKAALGGPLSSTDQINNPSQEVMDLFDELVALYRQAFASYEDGFSGHVDAMRNGIISAKAGNLTAYKTYIEDNYQGVDLLPILPAPGR